MQNTKRLLAFIFINTTLYAAPPINFQYCLKKSEQECVKSICHLKAQSDCYTRCHAIAKDKCTKLSKQLRLPGE